MGDWEKTNGDGFIDSLQRMFCLQLGFYNVSDYTLLTGSTGLLGRYLLCDLLQAGHRVAVVARPNKKETVAQRIESILQVHESETGVSLPRPVCLEGDITKEYLGLDEVARQWVSEYCSTMLHSAAALKFHEEADGEPWRTNVGGTRHVLDLCRDTGIRRLHYVSTAYVCGKRDERIMEGDLDCGQEFRNDYEKSKLEAEVMVRNADFIDELTVYRPAVIAGDSQTGYTSTYHGLLMYLQLMCVLARNTEPGPDGVRHTEVELQISGDEPRNVIPVDWSAAVIAHLFGNPKSHGRTFHLAPRVRMTARQMVEAGYSYFNSTGVKFVGLPEGEQRPDSELGRSAYESSMMYREYEDCDPEFDTTNLQEFAGHLPCPIIDEAMLHRFMAYGEEDRWGKRRQKQANIPFNVEAYLEQLVNPDGDLVEERSFGLDVLGAGGGQWTVFMAGGHVVAFEPGISSSVLAVLSVTSDKFVSLVEEALPKPVKTIANRLTETAAESGDSRLAESIATGLFSYQCDSTQRFDSDSSLAT